MCVISDANDGVNKTIKQKGIFEVKGNVVDGALCAAEQCDANIYIIRERETTTTVDPIKYIQGRNIKARSTGYKTCNQERYIDLIIPCRTGARHFIQRSTFFFFFEKI